MSSMEKIVIIGSPGSGKTTLARKLGSLLDIEVFHLDRFFWNPGWEEKPLTVRIKIQQQLVRGERWIMEGTYLSSSDDRLHAADTIVFLDMPFQLCLSRIIKRRFQQNNKFRSDLPQGCPEQLHWSFILKVLAFPFRERRLLLKKFAIRASHADSKEAQLFWFRSSKEVEDFLKNCTPTSTRNIAVPSLVAPEAMSHSQVKPS